MQITWPDGHISLFDGQWLKNNSDLRARKKVLEDEPQPILWSSKISAQLCRECFSRHKRVTELKIDFSV